MSRQHVNVEELKIPGGVVRRTMTADQIADDPGLEKSRTLVVSVSGEDWSVATLLDAVRDSLGRRGEPLDPKRGEMHNFVITILRFDW